MSKKPSLEIIEKRKFLRLQDYFRVVLTPETAGTAAPAVGYSKNLSVGGLCFIAAEPVAEGTRLRADIQIPELGEPLAVTGEVLRVRPVEGGRHEIVLRFVHDAMDDETRNRLELFIFDHFL